MDSQPSSDCRVFGHTYDLSMRKRHPLLRFAFLLIFIAAFAAVSEATSFASDLAIQGDPFYPQIEGLTYDYTLQGNHVALTIDMKVRYHANPASFIDLLYVTARNSIPGCQSNAPSGFTFGLSTSDVLKKNFNTADSLNQTSLVSRVQDSDWKVDEYKSTSIESGFGQDYFDHISKCGNRFLSDVTIYDISGKSTSISLDDTTPYQFNLDRGIGSLYQTGLAPYDTEQLKCANYSQVVNNLKQSFQTACTHKIQLFDYPISYAVAANPKFSISVISKAAADKAAADKAVVRNSSTVKSIITCVKGKIVKKINAVKPICPVGFRKSA